MSKYSKDVIQMLYEHQSEYISGQHIATQLSISRTAVKKIIDQLKEEGCQIESLNQRGHRLVSLPDKWYSGLVLPIIEQYNYFDVVDVHRTVDSTQLLAKQRLVGNQQTFLILSDEQSAGKGRFNRQWNSPRGKGLWMSLVLRPQVAFSMITTFNLFIALGIREAIQSFTKATVSVKWPNDIYIEGRKVCGFLTEMVANSDGIEAVICGIGINMNHLAEDFDASLRDKATSIRLHTPTCTKVNRYQFLQTLIKAITRRYEQFLNEPFSTIREEYIAASNIWGRQLKFTENSEQFLGEVIDIDQDGFLIIRDLQGNVRKLMSADIEL